jgi:hypothetical protein
MIVKEKISKFVTYLFSPICTGVNLVAVGNCEEVVKRRAGGESAPDDRGRESEFGRIGRARYQFCSRIIGDRFGPGC